MSNLILDSKGNLYGTSVLGGKYNSGFVFGLKAQGGGRWSEIDIYDFTGGSDGGTPMSNLTLQAGTLYGTTASGGSAGYGTVYRVTPTGSGTWNESVLYSFQGGDDGATPEGGVVFGTGGALYGTASAGGSDADGTVFKLTPPSAPGPWTLNVLYAFTGIFDGGRPEATLLLRKGTFYGTTTSPSAVFDVKE